MLLLLSGASTNQMRNACTVESAEHFTRSGQQTAWNDDELDLAEMNHILANVGQAHSQSGVADQFALLKRGYDDTGDRSWAEIDRALQMLSEVSGGLGSTDVSDDGSSVSPSLGRLSTYNLDAESYHRNEMYNKQEPTVEHPPYENQDEFLAGPEAYAISSRAHAAELGMLQKYHNIFSFRSVLFSCLQLKCKFCVRLPNMKLLETCLIGWPQLPKYFEKAIPRWSLETTIIKFERNLRNLKWKNESKIHVNVKVEISIKMWNTKCITP